MTLIPRQPTSLSMRTRTRQRSVSVIQWRVSGGADEYGGQPRVDHDTSAPQADGDGPAANYDSAAQDPKVEGDEDTKEEGDDAEEADARDEDVDDVGKEEGDEEEEEDEEEEDEDEDDEDAVRVSGVHSQESPRPER